jgi:predicted homoserine dehydrogenase-like protein
MRIRAYVTKWALTSGVILVEGELHDESGRPDLLEWMTASGGRVVLLGEGREWHRTWKDAKLKADMMRTSKIAVMRRRIASLLVREFQEPVEMSVAYPRRIDGG